MVRERLSQKFGNKTFFLYRAIWIWAKTGGQHFRLEKQRFRDADPRAIVSIKREERVCQAPWKKEWSTWKIDPWPIECYVRSRAVDYS